MNLLRMLKITIDRKLLETIYFSYIRSLLEYADIRWDNCSQQDCNNIEKIQLEAGRIITGSTKLVEISKLYKELGWLELSERRDLHKLFLFTYQIFSDPMLKMCPHIGYVMQETM